MQNNVVVFGAAGFIGKHLVSQLVREGYNVTAICRCGTRNTKLLKEQFADKISVFEMDVCKLDVDVSLLQCFLPKNITCVYMGAWNGTQKELRNDEQINNASRVGNIACLKKILEVAECENIVSFGTQAEYGRVKDSIVTEETVPCPNTAYGREKYMFYKEAEEICKERNTNFVEYRLHSVYGPERGGVFWMN